MTKHYDPEKVEALLEYIAGQITKNYYPPSLDAFAAAVRASAREAGGRVVDGWAIRCANGEIGGIHMEKWDAEFNAERHPLKPWGEGARAVPCRIEILDAPGGKEE